MSSIVVSGDTSGTITLTAPAVAGTNTLTLAAGTGTLGPKVLSTAVDTTSGTSIDFTNIPSWVTRITVMFRAVSTNGSSAVIVQLGTNSGGVETSGYTGSGDYCEDNNSGANMSAGFFVDIGILASAAAVRTGKLVIDSFGSNIWVCTGSVSNQSQGLWLSAGSKALSGTLDRVRITATNGTDTFDAGSVNIIYE